MFLYVDKLFSSNVLLKSRIREINKTFNNSFLKTRYHKYVNQHLLNDILHLNRFDSTRKKYQFKVWNEKLTSYVQMVYDGVTGQYLAAALAHDDLNKTKNNYRKAELVILII